MFWTILHYISQQPKVQTALEFCKAQLGLKRKLKGESANRSSSSSETTSPAHNESTEECPMKKFCHLSRVLRNGEKGLKVACMGRWNGKVCEDHLSSSSLWWPYHVLDERRCGEKLSPTVSHCNWYFDNTRIISTCGKDILHSWSHIVWQTK